MAKCGNDCARCKHPDCIWEPGNRKPRTKEQVERADERQRIKRRERAENGKCTYVDGNRQVKSRRRVREFGEVFTAEREVKAMCDLIPAEMYEIGHVFLEPCCGNGNFLAEILRRKLDNCRDAAEAEAAVRDIYAIDIQADNVAESKARMQAIVAERFPGADVSGILRRNIVCGDSLKITEKLAEGKTWEETTT